MRRRQRAVVFLCVLLATGFTPAQQPPPAQPPSTQPAPAPPPPKGKPYALIFGTVYGPDDRPVYGAQVRIRRADGKKVQHGDDLVSDHQGEFALRLPAETADYVVRATAKAGKRKLAAETKVHITFDERMDVGLHLTE